MIDQGKPRGRRTGKFTSLTIADVVVLSLLEERPMHGYDLVAEYERQEVIDWASVSKAQVYYALRKLESKKLIAGQIEEGGTRDRTIYRPTALGRDALIAELKKTSWVSSRIAQPFTTWFGLSVHLSNEDQHKLLLARRDHLRAEIKREISSLEFIETLTTDRAQKGALIVSLVINQIKAELSWIEGMLELD